MSDTNRFPSTTTTGYKSTGWTSRQANGYYQYGANGTLSKLSGSHNLKVGGDYRTIGRFTLHSSKRIRAGSNDATGGMKILLHHDAMDR